MPISRPHSSEIVPYFQRYTDLVIIDVLSALPQQMISLMAIASKWTAEDWAYSYAPGKWTLKESFLHLIDTERVFMFRALWIARGATTALPGFDQDAFAPASGANQRTGASLLAEYQSVRAASISLFENLPPEAWDKIGTSSGGPLSVRAAAYIIAGHELYHMNLFKEKYQR